MKIIIATPGSSLSYMEQVFSVESNRFKQRFTVKEEHVPFVTTILKHEHSKRTIRKLAKHFGLRFP